ncbi:MAG: efflux RND transporter periplasmic adaptor subunit [Acidobacteriia bacterium]|nr:efflux RND transporter periplasmic adaptor subunit [Terriglobia bacterium]
MLRGKICLLVVPLLFVAACTKPKEEVETAAPAPVQVAAVTQATIRHIVGGDGVLFPEDQASVMPKIAAPVQRFYVNRGDHVKQGQLLAVLENRDLVAAVAESKGAVDQAESNLRSIQGAAVPDAVVKAQTDLDAAREARDAARKVLDSRQQLFKEGALPGRQVDESQLAYAQAANQFQAAAEHLRTLQSVSKEEQLKGAAAQVEAAKAHYQSQEAQVAYSRIVSPISGVIADRPLYAGEMASPGAPLLTVMDLSRVVARLNVPQAEATLVKVGQSALVTQADKGEELNGKVTVVSPATDANTTTVQVWVEINNPGERLKPGTSVHAAIVTEELKDATVVPAAAILPGDEGGTAVLTVTPDSIAHKKAVKLGVREGDQVQIASGVAPGEQVVVVGGLGVDDKAKVKVIPAAAKESPDEDKSDEKGAPAGKEK